METVLERGKGAYHFDSYYESLCALQSSVPLASVKANLDRNILDVNADKMRLVDWPPILKAIQINKSLVRIAVHSRFEPPLADTPSSSQDRGVVSSRRTPRTPASKLKAPAAHSREITYELCKAIKSCLYISEQLKSLEIEGLPLRPRDVAQLSKGISKCFMLRELSLRSSHIGEALTVLCDGLKNASSINSLDLSGCNLTDGAVQAISRVVTHQAVMRHNEAWKSSLRYRAPDLDCMPGLRCITLNRNPLLGDSAAHAIADSLKDDLWLKAINLQECGLTDAGAEALLDALRMNTTVLILDIRGNHLVNRNLIDRVIQQVLINSEGKTTEYEWLPVEDATARGQTPSTNKRQLRERTHVITPSTSSPAVSAARRSVLSNVITPNSVPKQRGLPWRTAQRASAHKYLVASDAHAQTPRTSMSVVSHEVDDNQPSLTELRNHRHQDYDEQLGVKVLSSSQESLTNSDKENGDNCYKISMSSQAPFKQLQAEVISLKRRLQEESKARLAAEDRALELARENRRLYAELKHSGSVRADSGSGRAPVTASVADDELLEQVETAFSKFNQFLDIVRDTGLGHLIHEAGLDQFASTSSPLPAPARLPDCSGYSVDVKAGGSAPPLNFSDYVMARQVALQSDDIIRPTEPTNTPKKSYAELVTGSPTIAAAVATTSAHQELDDEQTPTKDLADDADNVKLSGMYDLKDVSELDSAKPSPRPDEQTKAAAASTMGQSQLLTTTTAMSTSAALRTTTTISSKGRTDTTGAEDAYASDEFLSASSSQAKSLGSNTKSDKVSASEAVSYQESADGSVTSSNTDEVNPAISNLKSLSELGSSSEHISSL